MDFTFPDLSREKKIDELLRWRFGSLAPPPGPSLASPRTNRGSWNQQAEEERQERIKSYRAQLEAKATDELDALYREESAAQYSEQQARREAEEASRFFNQRNARLDYEYRAKMAYLEPDEAVAVLLDKSPEVVNWERLKSLVNVSPFAKKYQQTRKLVLRAVDMKQLSDHVSPRALLAWADQNGIEYPESFKRSLEQLRASAMENAMFEAPIISSTKDSGKNGTTKKKPASATNFGPGSRKLPGYTDKELKRVRAECDRLNADAERLSIRAVAKGSCVSRPKITAMCRAGELPSLAGRLKD